MNIYFAIAIIIAFYLFAEALTKTYNKYDNFLYYYIMIIRLLCISIACILLAITGKKYNDYEFLEDANEFKYELIIHQDKLINYQTQLINSLENEDCDVSLDDITLHKYIKKETKSIDSLYFTQL